MIRFTIIGTSGQVNHVEANEYDNLKDVIQQSCPDEILALCGGSCSCATCHIFISASTDFSLEISEDESDLLADAPHRKANSRLACQVSVDGRLNDATVTIAPQD